MNHLMIELTNHELMGKWIEKKKQEHCKTQKCCKKKDRILQILI